MQFRQQSATGAPLRRAIFERRPRQSFEKAPSLVGELGGLADQLRNGPALAPQVLLDLQLVANVDWRGVQHQLCFA